MVESSTTKFFEKEMPYFYVKRFLNDLAPIHRTLVARGLIPEPFLLSLETDTLVRNGVLYMQRINGEDLFKIAEDDTPFRYSEYLAKGLARNFNDSWEVGVRQSDPHPGNFMYDRDNDRIVTVDVESITPTTRKLTDFVQEYSFVMTRFYTWPEINHGFKPELAIMLLDDLVERDTEGRVNLRIVDFLRRGVNAETVPQNFDEILALKR